jgi:xanthine/CO dehydrogenase XdhC/CoxF family maturation factor
VNKELELWRFIADRLAHGKNVMLLVVAESSGSSPGRQGYKMAVASEGELLGSIGGGVMEVNLVEQSRALLSVPPPVAGGSDLSVPPAVAGGLDLSVPPAVAGGLQEQVHRKNATNAS